MSDLTAEQIQQGRGPDRKALAARRRLAHEMLSVRERIASASGLGHAFDVELLRQFAQQQVSASNPLFDGFFAWADHLIQLPLTTSQLTAAEHRWTRVFVQCARPTVSLVERLQLAKRASFLRQHARQISEITALAARLPGAGH